MSLFYFVIFCFGFDSVHNIMILLRSLKSGVVLGHIRARGPWKALEAQTTRSARV